MLMAGSLAAKKIGCLHGRVPAKDDGDITNKRMADEIFGMYLKRQRVSFRNSSPMQCHQMIHKSNLRHAPI